MKRYGSLILFTVLIFSFQNCTKEDHSYKYALENCLTPDDLEIISYQDVVEKNQYTFQIHKKRRQSREAASIKPTIQWYMNDSLEVADGDEYKKTFKACDPVEIKAELNSCDRMVSTVRKFTPTNCP